MPSNDYIRRIIESTNRYYEPAIRAANQANEPYRSIQPQLKKLVNQIHMLEEGSRHALVRTFTFARGGWHEAPLMESTVSSVRTLLDELVDKTDDEVKKELDREIPEYFRRDDHHALRNMIDRWDLFPGIRNQIFEDALWAHENGKYTLSVQSLAPQVEGILRKETSYYNRGPGWIRQVNKALDFHYDPAHPPSSPTAEDLGEALDALLTQPLPDRYQQANQVSLEHALFRVNELYNNGQFSDPQFVNSLNRHAILHGVSEDFNEVMSIKLFCAVQLVHEIAVEYREVRDS